MKEEMPSPTKKEKIEEKSKPDTEKADTTDNTEDNKPEPKDTIKVESTSKDTNDTIKVETTSKDTNDTIKVESTFKDTIDTPVRNKKDEKRKSAVRVKSESDKTETPSKSVKLDSKARPRTKTKSESRDKADNKHDHDDKEKDEGDKPESLSSKMEVKKTDKDESSHDDGKKAEKDGEASKGKSEDVKPNVKTDESKHRDKPSVSDSVKENVRAVLLSKTDGKGVLVSTFQRDYKHIIQEPLLYHSMGYSSLPDFLKAIPDVCRLEFSDADMAYKLFGIAKANMFVSSFVRKAEGHSNTTDNGNRRRQDLSADLNDEWQANPRGMFTLCFPNRDQKALSSKEAVVVKFSKVGEVAEINITTGFTFVRFRERSFAMKALELWGEELSLRRAGEKPYTNKSPKRDNHYSRRGNHGSNRNGRRQKEQAVEDDLLIDQKSHSGTANTGLEEATLVKDEPKMTTNNTMISPGFSGHN